MKQSVHFKILLCYFTYAMFVQILYDGKTVEVWEGMDK